MSEKDFPTKSSHPSYDLKPYLKEARRLTEGEISFLRTIFGKWDGEDVVDYDEIYVRKGVLITSFGSAVTIDNCISFPADDFTDDFSDPSDPNNLGKLAWLTHEVTHVWQYQRTDYWWFLALLEHLKYGDEVYKYDLDKDKKLMDYRWEQQGQIIEHYVIARALQYQDLRLFKQIIYQSIPHP